MGVEQNKTKVKKYHFIRVNEKTRDEKDQSPISLLSDEIKRSAKMTSVINRSWPLKKEVSNPETSAMNLDFRKPLNVTTPHSSVTVSKRRS